MSTERDAAPEMAERVLEALRGHNLRPSRVLPSAEGGVGICFVAGTRYADVECFSTGEVVAIRKDTASGEQEVRQLDASDLRSELLWIASFMRADAAKARS